jgi:hypothetical protein
MIELFSLWVQRMSANDPVSFRTDNPTAFRQVDKVQVPEGSEAAFIKRAVAAFTFVTHYSLKVYLPN